MPPEARGIDARPGCERVVGPLGEHPGQIDNGALLDAAHRPADGDPGNVGVARQKGVEAPATGGLGQKIVAGPLRQPSGDFVRIRTGEGFELVGVEG